MKQYEKDYIVAYIEDKFETIEISMVKCIGDEIIIHYESKRINYDFGSLKVKINNSINYICHDVVTKIMKEVRSVI